MSVIPKTMGLVVPGKMVKHYDAENNETTLDIDRDQADHMLASLGTVKDLFARISEAARSQLAAVPEPPKDEAPQVAAASGKTS